MTPAPPHLERDCTYLLRRGMSVLCIDSTEPSRKNCDHCVSPQCFATHTTTPSERDKVLNKVEKLLRDCKWLPLTYEDTFTWRQISGILSVIRTPTQTEVHR